MGWFTVNKIEITRDYRGDRKYIVKWKDEQLGEQTKEFTYEQLKEALEFLQKEFSQLSM